MSNETKREIGELLAAQLPGDEGHWVQVETYPMVLSRWHCVTCGAEGDGYPELTRAIELADAHAEEHKPGAER